jgi:hypothetical protein
MLIQPSMGDRVTRQIGVGVDFVRKALLEVRDDFTTGKGVGDGLMMGSSKGGLIRTAVLIASGGLEKPAITVGETVGRPPVTGEVSIGLKLGVTVGDARMPTGDKTAVLSS